MGVAAMKRPEDVFMGILVEYLIGEREECMKEIKLYQCEICEARYENSKLAKECELSHRMPKMVEGKNYRAKYPYYVNVTFDDGSVRRYEAEKYE